ncbi:MAG: hypothetical protein ABSB18_00235 [Candidatus Omnitrophota bacterium]
MLTSKEEKTLQLIKQGSLRKRRILAILVLCALFISLSSIFIKKSESNSVVIQNKLALTGTALSNIKTVTPLEAQLKIESLRLFKKLQTVVSVSLFVFTYLILALFSVIFMLLCISIALSGSRDNLIKKIITPPRETSDKQ